MMAGSFSRVGRLGHGDYSAKRAATSPAANYAEAKESVSTRDYVHKLKICVKELREAQTWLRLAQATGFRQTDLQALIAESDELIAICVTCVRRATGR